jgi:hypothetical protein
MAQVINIINFMGRQLLEEVEEGRFKLGEMTELDRQATLNALSENEIAKVEAIEETEDGTFLLALETREVSVLMGNYFADYAPLVATIKESDGFLGSYKDYLLFATVQADGEVADEFRKMIESEYSYSTYVKEFDDREGYLAI